MHGASYWGAGCQGDAIGTTSSASTTTSGTLEEEDCADVDSIVVQ